MPSELQRVARGLVDCFDEIPRVVEQLQRTAARCRENAQVALIASRGQATVAAQQLDAAARACEAAAHFLSMTPPKARGWAEGLVGTAGPSTNRPSSDSAKRNKATGGSVDIDHKGRTKRLSFDYDDVEVAEDNEPPVVTVARKAFEKFRKDHEQDAGRDDDELLEFEITVAKTGELEFEERDEKEEQQRNERLSREFELEVDRKQSEEFELEERDEKEEEKRAERLTRDFGFGPEREEPEPVEPEERDEKEEEKRAERLTRDFEIGVDLTEAVKALRESMAGSEDQQWDHATFTITPDHIEATFDYPENPPPAPIVVDIGVPGVPDPDDGHFDPAFDPRSLDVDFAPGVFDPDDVFQPKERAIADRLAEEGWRVDARPADHTRDQVPNPDSMVRKSKEADGIVIEFKTPISGTSNAIKRSIHDASRQAGERNEVLIDGRAVGLSEDTALRAFRRACGQPGGRVADAVHVILGDRRLITYTKEK
ncbi:hypothetical protein [Kribbella sp. NPDC004875]|uniref:hypothetical protein n=1 Tax=Kribbella sp. NPDC004875 TaxID=3364107 RepID=UPI00369E87CC